MYRQTDNPYDRLKKRLEEIYMNKTRSYTVDGKKYTFKVELFECEVEKHMENHHLSSLKEVDEKIGDFVGRDEKTVCCWRTGHNAPATLDMVYKVENFFGVEKGSFLVEEEQDVVNDKNKHPDDGLAVQEDIGVIQKIYLSNLISFGLLILSVFGASIVIGLSIILKGERLLVFDLFASVIADASVIGAVYFSIVAIRLIPDELLDKSPAITSGFFRTCAVGLLCCITPLIHMFLGITM